MSALLQAKYMLSHYRVRVQHETTPVDSETLNRSDSPPHTIQGASKLKLYDRPPQIGPGYNSAREVFFSLQCLCPPCIDGRYSRGCCCHTHLSDPRVRADH